MIIHNHDGIPDGNTEDPVLVTTPREGIPDVVDTPEALEAAVEKLMTVDTPVACDAERAQGFRYGADPYLIQIRREGAGTFLIDAHALPDLRAMQPLVDQSQRWLLHAADQDLPNLRQLGLSPRHLFDTEIAAQLLGFERIGLAAVCEQVLGLAIAKDHQAADWSVRPLPKDWLRYAALDVELLTELYRNMAKELHDLGRWDWAREEFKWTLAKPAPAPKPERWRTLPGASKIKSRRGLAVLKELFEARESVARQIDLSPGRLVRNAALVRAATQPPKTKRALMAMSEFRTPKAREYTDTWLRAINRGLTAHDKDLPPKHRARVRDSIPPVRQWARIDEDAFARLQAVRASVAEVAEGLGLSSETVLAPKVQRYMAWAPMDDPTRTLPEQVDKRFEEAGARNWQRTLTREGLVAALSEKPADVA